LPELSVDVAPYDPTVVNAKASDSIAAVDRSGPVDTFFIDSQTSPSVAAGRDLVTRHLACVLPWTRSRRFDRNTRPQFVEHPELFRNRLCREFAPQRSLAFDDFL
jgi:hypothetical protein